MISLHEGLESHNRCQLCGNNVAQIEHLPSSWISSFDVGGSGANSTQSPLTCRHTAGYTCCRAMQNAHWKCNDEHHLINLEIKFKLYKDTSVCMNDPVSHTFHMCKMKSEDTRRRIFNFGMWHEWSMSCTSPTTPLSPSMTPTSFMSSCWPTQNERLPVRFKCICVRVHHVVTK